MGSAAPGSNVSAEVQLRSTTGRYFDWATRQRVSATGEFRLRLPYATETGPELGVSSVGPYQLRTSRGVLPLEVTEASVRSGATIALPPVER